jgi:4-hydroxy-tetrahydrodipicolinate reductase
MVAGREDAAAAVTVAIYGRGQLASAVAAILSERSDVEVIGPASRRERASAVGSGADIVIIATTTRLADVADDVRDAVHAGSNVIVSAEESSVPWAVDAELATQIDVLARERGVTVLGAGINPGFIFDALLLTLLGTVTGMPRLEVRRDVDISGFGTTVLGRLGIGFVPDEFERRVAESLILGHAGFPQSMGIVANALGIRIDRIERTIEPILATSRIDIGHAAVEAGQSAGVRQDYVAWVADRPWYTATFNGHIDPAGAGIEPKDVLRVIPTGAPDFSCTLSPGVNAQRGSSAVIANSVDRVLNAPSGWITVADLPPARPTIHLPGNPREEHP